MKQADLNRAVARATGETVDCIARMGFSLIVAPTPRPTRLPRLHMENARPSIRTQHKSRPRRLAQVA
jgi:hypothetical protein